MIKRSQMMEPMLDACPSFKPTYATFLNDWADEPDLPLYPAIGDFARHLSSLMKSGDTACLPAVFAVTEQWIAEGDEYVSKAAIVGLLESLQNTNLHDGTKPGDFVPYLPPQSLRWWKKVSDFWEKGIPLADD